MIGKRVKNPKFIIVKSHSNEVDLEIESSAYCEPGRVYFMQDKNRPILEHLKTLYQSEKEKNEWIRRYENVLNGLKYWREKALQEQKHL